MAKNDSLHWSHCQILKTAFYYNKSLSWILYKSGSVWLIILYILNIEREAEGKTMNTKYIAFKSNEISL